MNEYHKIQTMFKRENERPCRIIYGDWSIPEFEYLKDNQWEFTEKVDGTNIRVMWDGVDIKFGGKTDKAQMHCDLISRLGELFNPKKDCLIDMFKPKDGASVPVCLYGEAYGAGIQKGGLYKLTKYFVLFDVKVGSGWLKREDVASMADRLKIDAVPVVLTGTLQDGINLVKSGYKSRWGDFIAEGVVGRPIVELRGGYGRRIITKIKYCDFGTK